jgi:hypothetical protein
VAQVDQRSMAAISSRASGGGETQAARRRIIRAVAHPDAAQRTAIVAASRRPDGRAGRRRHTADNMLGPKHQWLQTR